MEINPKVRRLWNEKNKDIRTMMNWCEDCCDSGCNEPDKHDLRIMQFAYDLGRKTPKQTKKP